MELSERLAGLRVETDPQVVNQHPRVTVEGLEVDGPAAYLAAHGPFVYQGLPEYTGFGKIGVLIAVNLECVAVSLEAADALADEVHRRLFTRMTPWSLMRRAAVRTDVGATVSLTVQRNDLAAR